MNEATVNGYPVIKYEKVGSNRVPLLNIEMMSDEMWNELAKRKSPL